MAETPKEINVDLVIRGEEALLLMAADLDTRRQEQIKRQGEIITRLMDDPEAYVVLELCGEVAALKTEIEKGHKIFRELIPMLRKQHAFHVIAIQERLDGLRLLFGFTESLEDIAAPVVPQAAQRYSFGQRKTNTVDGL